MAALKRTDKHLSLLILLFVLCLVATAQKTKEVFYDAAYVYKVWNNQNGLPQNTVMDIVTDKDGYLWLATEEGLARFDGTSFMVLNEDNTPNLFSSSFFALTHSSRKGIWASSRNTVLFIQDLDIQAYDFRKYLNNSWITCMSEDNAGTLWIGTYAGDLFYLKNKTITKYNPWKDTVSRSIQVMEKAADGMLIGTNEGLYQLRPSPQKIIRMPGFQSINVKSLAVDKYQNVWVGTLGDGLYRLSSNTSRFTTKEGLKDQFIFSLKLTPDGDLWIGTQSAGIQCYSKGKFIRPFEQAILSEPVQSIYITGKNLVWVGTTGSGLIQVKPASVQMLSKKIALTDNIILPVYEHENGEIWIGTAGKGINRIVKGVSQAITTKDGLASDLILSVYGRGNEIYIGTPNGVNRFNLITGKIDRHITTKNGLTNNIIKTVFYDSDNRLWLIGRSGGIHHLLPDGRVRRIPVPKALWNADLSGIFEDSKKNIWIGGNGSGAIRIDATNTLMHINKKAGLMPDVVECFYEDKTGAIWMGTEKGLVRFSDNKFKLYNKSNGLRFNYTCQIIDDKTGFLWISGYFGLQRIALKDLESLQADASGYIPSRLFSTSDGMANPETNSGIFPAGWRMKDKSIWFPTVEGVAIVKPDYISKSIGPVTIKVQSIRFGNKQKSTFSKVAIPAGVSNIEITYTSIDFSYASDINYSYRLLGLDKQWVAAGNRRTAYFTHLNPGKYVFEVRAERYGEWSPVETITFEVNPFFYQTSWFFALIILCTLGALGLVLLNLKRKADQLAREQKKIMEAQIYGQEKERLLIGSELHDNINQRLTTAKLYLDIGRSDPNMRLDMVERSETVINNVISEIRSLCKSLIPPTLKDIGLQEALLELLDCYRIIGKLKISFNCPDSLDDISDNLQLTIYRITQEHLNNVIKYAEAEKIWIRINNIDGNIYMSIKDNGKGFNVNTKSKGVGLTNMKNRVGLFNGSFEIISSPGYGCTLNIIVPCRK